MTHSHRYQRALWRRQRDRVPRCGAWRV